MNPLCSVELSEAPNATVATLRGEIDLSNASDIEEQLAHAAQQAAALVVDLEALAYIDSSGFGMLERLSRKAKLRVAVPPTAVVHRAFVVTGLAQVVPVFPSVRDALADG
jgi:anti-anti-sigma factor